MGDTSVPHGRGVRGAHAAQVRTLFTRAVAVGIALNRRRRGVGSVGSVGTSLDWSVAEKKTRFLSGKGRRLILAGASSSE